MTQRMKVFQIAPDGYRAVQGLEKYTRSRLDHTVLELIKVRASILNGCAFCLDMHTTDALKAGETTRRLFAVGAWHEAPFFDKRERAALALTDEVTKIGEHGVSDEVWEEVRSVWSEEETADLLLAIATINVWNRIAVATRQPPPAD
jgi:AhpD family alkylhydroperoxidase